MTTLRAAPLVSVILPVFNVAQFLEECLDSVYAQTLKRVEIIAVDDGSTDGSLTILRQHASAGRLKLVEQANSGAGAARNRGMELAQGAYIFFLDPDDLLAHERVLEMLVTVADREEADMCGGNVVLLRASGERSRYQGCEVFGERVDRTAGYADIFGFWRFLYRRAFLRRHGLIFPAYRRFEDPVFLVNALRCFPAIVRVADDVYIYRDSGTTDWTDERKISDVLEGLRETLRLTAKVAEAPQLHQRALSQFIALTRRVFAPYVEDLAFSRKGVVLESLEETLAEVNCQLLSGDVPKDASVWLALHAPRRHQGFGVFQYVVVNILNGKRYIFKAFGCEFLFYERTVKDRRLSLFGLGTLRFGGRRARLK